MSDYKTKMDAYSRELIIEELHRNRFNIKPTAAVLGIHRATLTIRMKELDIPRKPIGRHRYTEEFKQQLIKALKENEYNILKTAHCLKLSETVARRYIQIFNLRSFILEEKERIRKC